MKIFSAMIKSFLIYGIKIYQKYISPYKGFKCAHKAHAYGMSCSSYGLFVLNNHSLKESLFKINERLQACKEIYILFKQPSHSTLGKLKNQQGAIDCVDVDVCDCDIGSNSGKGKGCSFCIDVGSVGDCSLFEKKEKSSNTLKANTFRKNNNKSKDTPFYNFLLLDETSHYKIYKHNSGRYFKIDKNIKSIKEEEILSNSSLHSKELDKNELKNFFKNKK